VSGSVTVASNASSSPATISLSGIGSAAGPHSAALSWTASKSVVIGYNVYRSSVSGGPYTKLTATVDSATTYSDSSVQAGLTYYYVVTAVNSSDVESAHSMQVSATIP
jgi:fibronectin type 3 domain-containing protein